MHLYADEDFQFPAVEELHLRGHDVITAQEDGRSSAPDSDILDRANALGRAVLTDNRRDFERLHRQGIPHSGIVSASQDNAHIALAGRLDAVLIGRSPDRWSIRVNKPSNP